MLRAETIKERHSDIFTFLQGDLAATATHCHQPEETSSESLVYLSEQKHLDTVACHEPAIVIVHSKLLPSINATREWQGCLFSVTAMPSAMAALLTYFDRKAERFGQWGRHHPTALVHATATIGEDVMLGPYCVIGANTVIGDGCLIGSHTVVENDVSIGARTILHPGSAVVTREPGSGHGAPFVACQSKCRCHDGCCGSASQLRAATPSATCLCLAGSIWPDSSWMQRR